jgi:hypothetical protein
MDLYVYYLNKAGVMIQHVTVWALTAPFDCGVTVRCTLHKK